MTVTFRRLPYGRRTGLADPRGVSTAAPDSKIMGNPVDVLQASTKPQYARVLSPLTMLDAKPAGAFELAYAGVPVQSASFRIRQELRQETERADRYARVRSAPTVHLGAGRMTGWDWIRWGRTIRPADRYGVRGPVRVTRAPAERGVLAQQLEIPESVLVALAESGKAARIMPSAKRLPLGTPRTPMLTDVAKSTRPPGPVEDNRFQLLYLGAAVFVVFLLMWGRK